MSIHNIKKLVYIECHTRYRTRHFFNNFTTNEDIATKQTHTTDTFLFISHTTNVLLFKFRCNIFIGFRISKEMPGSVASGIPYIMEALCSLWGTNWTCTYKEDWLFKAVMYQDSIISRRPELSYIYRLQLNIIFRYPIYSKSVYPERYYCVNWAEYTNGYGILYHAPSVITVKRTKFWGFSAIRSTRFAPPRTLKNFWNTLRISGKIKRKNLKFFVLLILNIPHPFFNYSPWWFFLAAETCSRLSSEMF